VVAVAAEDLHSAADPQADVAAAASVVGAAAEVDVMVEGAADAAVEKAADAAARRFSWSHIVTRGYLSREERRTRS